MMTDMPEKPQPLPESPVTARAVSLGLFFALLVNLVMPYNDHYLLNTLLIGNHFPYISIALLMVLILGVNAGLSRFFGVKGLTAGELVLIWGMIGVSGGICSAGLMRYLPSWLVIPAYYTETDQQVANYVVKYIPDWMLVSKNPADPAVQWYMEGLPAGESIPWGPWILPLALWILFMLLLYASNFAFVAFFFRQWSARERLVFPLVQLPLFMAEEPRKGSSFNAFLGNWVTWVGFAVPCLVWGMNGLKYYIPELPQMFYTTYPVMQIFPDRPWSEFGLADAKILFTVIGLTFLLTTEIAFSMWFFYILYRLTFVYIAWLGAAGTGFWGNWYEGMVFFEHTGVKLGIAGFLFWTARDFLKGWWRRVISGKTDPGMDVLPPRWTLALFVLGVLGMVLWQMLAGAQFWLAVVIVFLSLVTILVLTRIVAEAGVFFVTTSATLMEFSVRLFPASWLGPISTNVLLMNTGVLSDTREILMPYVVNGLKAAEAVRMRLGKVMAVFALAAAISLGTSALSRIVTGYKYGAINVDTWLTVKNCQEHMDDVARHLTNPDTITMTLIGETKILPVNVVHMAIGAATATALFILRAKFIWWPLHPFGLAMATTWCMEHLWFSFFLGWVAKASVMKFGGASVYRRILPFFLGLVLGECIMAALWAGVGLATGAAGFFILPD